MTDNQLDLDPSDLGTQASPPTSSASLTTYGTLNLTKQSSHFLLSVVYCKSPNYHFNNRSLAFKIFDK